jgi:hypothetical protein
MEIPVLDIVVVEPFPEDDESIIRGGISVGCGRGGCSKFSM